MFCHLFIILTVNIKGSFDGYYGFYFANKKYNPHPLHNICKAFLDYNAINYYVSNTGFDTGYGFFAPNVASDFVLNFTIKDENNQMIESRTLPSFNNKESFVRFTTTFTFFLEKLDKKSNQGLNDYLKIIVKQISLDVKKEYPKAKSVDTKMYLYHFPDLNDYANNQKPKLILIDSYEF